MTTGHSEDYFNSYRDFWWNHDFLELMARRLKLRDCQYMLDVGCGRCHWSRLLAGFLARPASVTGLDSDPKWAAGDPAIEAEFNRMEASIALRKGDANSMPFEKDFFDIATCQTVLIHIEEPERAIAEMLRVVKPGGLVLCAEPNNIAGTLVKSNVSADDTVKEMMRRVEHAMLLERGKIALGEGDNSVGDLLPGLFADAGFEDIRVYLSDKAMPLYPPYDTPEQRAILDNIDDWEERDAGIQDWSEKERQLAALGNEASDKMSEVKDCSSREMFRFRESVRDNAFTSGGASFMYLVSGRKPLKPKT